MGAGGVTCCSLNLVDEKKCNEKIEIRRKEKLGDGRTVHSPQKLNVSEVFRHQARLLKDFYN